MDRSVMGKVAYGFTGAAAVAYLAARAILVPLTYDEAATFVRYVDEGFASIFDFNVATNHLLNTSLTWLSYQVFGGAPWALRLPNVAAGVGFIVSAGAIARRANSPVVGFAGFVVMVANPYLLDYLALSRGYGLALCLLTACVYNLLCWFDRPPDSPEAWRRLARGVWLAAIAVLATFTVLPAFLAVIAVVSARLVWAGRRQAAEETDTRGVGAWRFLAGWLLLAAGFSLMVFSRQQVLSSELFTPILVRTVGLFESENEQIQVLRADPTGRFRPLERETMGVWRSDPMRNAWGLRIELPTSVDRNLTSLQVTIGTQVFRRDRHEDGPWTVWDSGSHRVLRSTAALAAPRSHIGTVAGAINWGGDAGQWRLAAAYTAGLVALLAIGAASLAGAASMAVRAGRIGYGEARLLVSALVAVAGLTAAPLYLLQRDGQLYFGGTTGLVSDTFGSLLDKTAYGAVYAPNQVPIALVCLALVAMALVVTLAAAPPRRPLLAGPLMVLAIIALVAIALAAQHGFLGTPWLTGRTALFLLPLISTFVVLTADAFARFGSPARAIVSALMVLLALASGWHIARVANVGSAFDWPDDAATPAVLGEIAARIDGSERRTIRVGVQWMFYPVARYYADRMSNGSTAYAIEVAPGEGPAPDFVYTAERLDPSAATLVGGFTGTPAVLWQTRRPAGPP